MFVEKKLAYFVCGVVTGSLGLKALLGLRVKDNVLGMVDGVQANVDDVIAEAKAVNQEKKDAKAFVDANEETPEV